MPNSDVTPDTDPMELARELIANGIPVFVARPNPRWRAPRDGIPAEKEFYYPERWHTLTAIEGMADTFRPGEDALCMVAGHGIDVIDIDAKSGGDVSLVPAGIETFGKVATPSNGGHHLYVRSTGFGKSNAMRIGSTFMGDYAGGTNHGGSRMFVFLPGTARQAYPGRSYRVIEPIDIEKCMDSHSSDILIDWLISCRATSTGSEGPPPVGQVALTAFMAQHRLPPRCGFGRNAVRNILGSAPSTTGGRHGWFIHGAFRITELVRAGCCNAYDLEALVTRLKVIKPEGGTDAWAGIRAAIAKGHAATECLEHRLDLPSVDPQERTSPWVDWSDVWDGQETQEELIDDLLVAGSSTAIVSRFGGGKSFLALDLALSIALGLPFGRPLTEMKGTYKVAYVDYENPLHEILERLESMGYGEAHKQQLIGNFYYASMPDWTLDTPEGGAVFVQEILSKGISVVFLDTFMQSLIGKESEADTFTAFVRHTGKLLRRNGVALVRLDHEGLERGRARGSTQKGSDLDLLYIYDYCNETEVGTLTRTKNRLRLDPENKKGIYELKLGDRPGFPGKRSYLFTHAANDARLAAQSNFFDRLEQLPRDQRIRGHQLKGYRAIREAMKEHGLWQEMSQARLIAALAEYKRAGIPYISDDPEINLTRPDPKSASQLPKSASDISGRTAF